MTEPQSRRADLLRGAPFARRWQQLSRNIGVGVATQRLRVMAEVRLEEAALEPVSPRAVRHGRRMGALAQPANSAATRAKA